jgi:RES domain-containing protein
LLSTRGARLHGGRWNAPGLAVLYASLEPSVVRAERIRMMERQGLPESAAYPLRLGLIGLEAEVVDLCAAGALAALEVDEPISILTPVAGTRAVGAAAARLPLETLLVPSVTGAGRNLVIFTERLTSEPQVLETVDLTNAASWPADRA